MKIYKKASMLLSAIIVPLTFSGVVLVLCEAASLVSSPSLGKFAYVLDEMQNELLKLIPVFFSFCLTYYFVHGSKAYKASWSVFCLVIFGAAFSGMTDKPLYYIFGIALGGFCAYIFNHVDYEGAMVITALSALLLGMGFGWLYDIWDNLMIALLRVISGRGGVSALLFGVLNNIIKTVSTDFEDLVFSKSFGGAIAVDGYVVTGAKNIFIKTADAPGPYVSTYLAGRYLFHFAVAGMAVSLSNELPQGKRYALYTLTAAAVLSGNSLFLMIFILLQSPFLFLFASLLCGGCYLTASLMSLPLGFVHNGGLVELFMYMRSPVLFIAGGAVIASISYFVFRCGILKYDISENENIYIPKQLRGFLSSLGGIHNIICIKTGEVELRNVKLVNTLEVDGEIKENLFCTDDERLVELKDYI